jgi:hypothetical protein
MAITPPAMARVRLTVAALFGFVEAEGPVVPVEEVVPGDEVVVGATCDDSC